MPPLTNIDDRVISTPTASERLLLKSVRPSPDPRQRILVADDESGIRKLITMILDDEERTPAGLVHPGFNVLCVSDGDEALQVVANNWAPDLIIMDLMMPRLPGIIAIRKLKANPATARIPIIAMSAGVTLKHNKVPEADALLPKPFDIDGLVAHARFWADRYQHQQEATDCVLPG